MATSKGLRILFADDEPSLREFMRTELPGLGHEVTICADGMAAIKALEKGPFDVALLDIKMPNKTGIDVLEQIKHLSPSTEVVLLTGYASVDTAVQAVRLGAFDYLTKPCRLADLEGLLRRIGEKKELVNKTIALERRVKAAEGPTILVGESPAMQAVHRLVSRIAPTDSTVMILGETGTGKELVARTIVQQSLRADKPFIPVNCGALSEQLAESELFGHRKGAFTGADREHKGLFEVANGGTLFLDELGELNKNIQVKLLRFLEAREIRRVGETEPFKSDVRIICATNRDLREMVKADTFREDLFFRVNTFEVKLPSLKERRTDIPDLARHLLSRAARRDMAYAKQVLTPEAIDALLEHEWPGNVRELANAMEHAFIIAGGGPILAEHLPYYVKATAGIPVSVPISSVRGATPAPAMTGIDGRSLKDVEMEHIISVLNKHQGNKPAAATELGISLKTLYNRLNAWQDEKRVAG